MHWYKRDPNAALMGMATLSLEDRGAYNAILDLLYASDGDLPDDDRAIAKLLHVQTRTWLPIRKRLVEAGKIWSFDGKISAKRVEKELKTARELSEKQSKIAGKRWEKEEKPKENNGDVMPPGNASTSTSTSTSTKKERKRAAPHGAEFEKFWSAYPRKKAKRAAEKAFEKAIKESSIASILHSLAIDAAEWKDEKFTPFPATWLNRGSYLDHVQDPARTAVSDEFMRAKGFVWDGEKWAKANSEMEKQ